MGVPYDRFTEAFLEKVAEYDFLQMEDYDRTSMVDGFMKRAFTQFRKNCRYDFFTTGDDIIRVFDVDIPEDDLYEILDIVSEGMLVHWLKPYVYRQENLQNVLNTRDFTTYSPAEMLSKISSTHELARKRFINMIREYSYNHGDLEDLHL